MALIKVPHRFFTDHKERDLATPERAAASGPFVGGPGGFGAAASHPGGPMIAFPAGVRVWIAGGVTDMRRGMNTLALTVQQGLGRDPHAGEIFCFRGRKGDLVKLLWHDGVGMSLYTKRLEAGKFIWPTSGSGEAVQISAAQLGYLLEGIDWRNPRWTQRPAKAG